MSLLSRVRQSVRQHGLAGPETRVLVALSGGSDSVALCAILQDLAAAGEFILAGTAHFNHQLRASADDDERFAADVARRLGVPHVVGREDVGYRARRDRCSVETAARTARHEFFERARRELGADVVALGHTQDDQAETVLLRLVRGAGPRGLAAMYPRYGAIVRPLLECSRAELREFLVSRGLEYVEDPTNADVGIPRNRVRAELIPLLQERFNPRIAETLAHEAEIARELWMWLDAEAARFETSGGRDPADNRTDADSMRELDVAALRQAPPALRRLIVWRAMNAVGGGRTIPFRHVERALALLEVDHGTLDAPGQRVQRLGTRLVLSTGGERFVQNLFVYPLSIPGEVQIEEAGCTVSVEHGARPDESAAGMSSGAGLLALVREDRCGRELMVRNRRPGDRFSPVGLGGRKKLQDYLVDRKVARAGRDRVPLVVDGTDQIVWVAGYGIDEAFRVTDASQGVLLLRLKRLGGCA